MAADLTSPHSLLLMLPHHAVLLLLCWGTKGTKGAKITDDDDDASPLLRS